MNSDRKSDKRSSFLRTFAAFFAVLGIASISTDNAEARRLPPQPPPTPDAKGAFVCDTDLDGPASVKAAYEEFFTCLQPEFDAWIENHPALSESFELLYDRWKEGRAHDLRDRPEAGRWARQHSVDFSSREVELSSRQLRNLSPAMEGPPVEIPGNFLRFFVERASNRLFLTSETEGLVSINIKDRYAFEFEGKVGRSGATDFFVVDENTAFVEETVKEGGNRDLVVLDISDRQKPKEVSRLRGVIPAMAGPQSPHRGCRCESCMPPLSRRPAAFDIYLLYHEGLLVSSKCGEPPTVSSHPGIHCRKNGTCYRREYLDEPNNGVCRKLPPPQRRVRAGMIARDMDMGSRRLRGSTVGVGGLGTRGRAAPAQDAVMEREAAPIAPRKASPAPSPRTESSAVTESMPEGGAGGAGSLSQMMLYGNTLYVLSGDHAQAEGWLTTFDITHKRRPVLSHVIRLDNGPEALQRHDNLLLIAGRDALVTASLGLSNAPRVLGEYRQDCPVTFDPVVVQGSIAYRTIIVDQPTNVCSSRLEVIELSQPHQPVLRATRRVERPRGLAVLGERLFIADEKNGVKVFDLTDAVNPSETGLLSLVGVTDLVISGFDLYALLPSQVETYWVGPLFEKGVKAKDAMDKVKGYTTVKRKDKP